MSDEFENTPGLDGAQGSAYRVPRREFLDPGTRRLAIIAGGLGVVLLGVVGIWSFSRHHGGQIPVVEADSRPLRVKPDNPGGMQLAGANDEILSGDGGPQTGKLAAAPEAPDPEALRAQQQTVAPAMGAAAPAKPAVALAVPAVTPAAAPPTAAQTAAAQAAATPSSATLSSAGKVSVPAHQAAASAPAPKSRAEVQLAALESEDSAKAEWQRLSRKMPDVLKGHQPAVVKAERDGKTFWRLRTGGFDDIAQATAFCERVRSKGAGCAITSF